MPPPTIYIDVLPPFPYSRVVTKEEFNAVGGTIWFRFVTLQPTGFGGFSTRGGTFKPDTHFYKEDSTTLILQADTNSNCSWRTAVPAGIYWVKITKHDGGISDSNFTQFFDIRPVITSLNVGDIVISDSNDKFPATVTSSTGTFRGFLLDTIPNSVIGESLGSGETIWQDRFGLQAINKTSVFDANVQYLGSVDIGTGAVVPRYGRTGPSFYAFNPTTRNLYTISPGGVLVGPITNVPTTPAESVLGGIGISRDGLVMYFCQTRGITGPNLGSIQKWSIIGNVEMEILYHIPDFTPSEDELCLAGGDHPGDILIMPNGDVITWFLDDSAANYRLLRISDGGNLRGDYAFPQETQRINHIAHFDDSSQNIRIWSVSNSRLRAEFIQFNLAGEGEFITSFDQNMFEEGVNLDRDVANPWGCPVNGDMIVYKTGNIVVPPPGAFEGGIYQMVPGKRHDELWDSGFSGKTDFKIPRPIIRTGYLGD